ncbi:MAG: hypothetical protein WCD38_11750 [Candidatus Tumulicola sp.]
MSLNDYNRSKEIERADHSFTTLIMACMRKADTDNLEALKLHWPETWRELQERYNGPGGLTIEERKHANKYCDPSKPKIFICGAPGGLRKGDYIGNALAEDGTPLGEPLCSSLDFVMRDMGVTSDWKHDGYKKHYPDGYCLVWLGAWPEEGEHPAFDAALALNRAKTDDKAEIPS